MASFLVTLFYGNGRSTQRVAMRVEDFDKTLEAAAGYPMNRGTRDYLHDRLPPGLTKNGIVVTVEPILDVVTV